VAGKIAEHNRLVELLRDSIDKNAHEARQRMRELLEKASRHKQLEDKAKKLVAQFEQFKAEAAKFGYSVAYTGYGVPHAAVTPSSDHPALEEIQTKRDKQREALERYSREILVRALAGAKEDAGDIALPQELKDLL